MEFDYRQTLEELRVFWATVVDVWNTAFFGVDVGTVLGAILIFTGFLLLRGLFSRWVIKKIIAFSERTETSLDDNLVTNIQHPLKFVWVVLGAYFTIAYLPLEGEPAMFADRVVRSLIAFTIFWLIFNSARALTGYLGPLQRILTAAMLEWLIKAIKAAIILVGAATILEIWGIAVAPLIAGLGLFGVAVALGAQDLFKNLIAGLLILVERRFAKGDWVLVDGVVEGTVELIGFRSTLVRRFDKAPVYVPNGALSDNAVTNFSRMTYRRIYWKIGVTYDTTASQLQEVTEGIRSYVTNGEEFVDKSKAPLFIFVDSFNASSIDIMLYCFTKTTVWGEWLAIKERLAYRIKEIVEGAGTSFAFPSQSIYVESLPGPLNPELGGPQPESFVPPEAAPEKSASG